MVSQCQPSVLTRRSSLVALVPPALLAASRSQTMLSRLSRKALSRFAARSFASAQVRSAKQHPRKYVRPQHHSGVHVGPPGLVVQPHPCPLCAPQFPNAAFRRQLAQCVLSRLSRRRGRRGFGSEDEDAYLVACFSTRRVSLGRSPASVGNVPRVKMGTRPTYFAPSAAAQPCLPRPLSARRVHPASLALALAALALALVAWPGPRETSAIPADSRRSDRRSARDRRPPPPSPTPRMRASMSACAWSR